MSRVRYTRVYKQSGVNISNIIQCLPPPSNPKSASDENTSRTRVHNQVHTTLALINTRSIRNKADTICNYITEHDFDVICLTETWLTDSDDAVVEAITLDGYNFRHLPRVGVMYKASFHICSKTPIPAQSFEDLEVVLRHVRAASIVRVFTIYRPPSSGRKTTPFRLFVDEFSRVILGDFNVHYGDDRAIDDRAIDDSAIDDSAIDDSAIDDRDVTDLLRETDFQQHVTEPTHVGCNILDLVITRPRDNTTS